MIKQKNPTKKLYRFDAMMLGYLQTCERLRARAKYDILYGKWLLRTTNNKDDPTVDCMGCARTVFCAYYMQILTCYGTFRHRCFNWGLIPAWKSSKNDFLIWD